MGIPLQTVYGWIKSDWWPRMLEEAKREHQDLIESRLSDIVEKATAQLLDRVVNGDVHHIRGKEVRVPVQAKELGNIIDKLADKLRVMRNQPVRLTATAVFDPHKVAKTFAQVAEEVRDRVIVEG